MKLRVYRVYELQFNWDARSDDDLPPTTRQEAFVGEELIFQDRYDAKMTVQQVQFNLWFLLVQRFKAPDPFGGDEYDYVIRIKQGHQWVEFAMLDAPTPLIA